MLVKANLLLRDAKIYRLLFATLLSCLLLTEIGFAQVNRIGHKLPKSGGFSEEILLEHFYISKVMGQCMEELQTAKPESLLKLQTSHQDEFRLVSLKGNAIDFIEQAHLQNDPLDGWIYAIAWLDSPVEQDAFLLCGGDHPLKMFFNGEQLMGSDRLLKRVMDNQYLPIALKEGMNCLVVGARVNPISCRVGLRISGPEEALHEYHRRFHSNFLTRSILPQRGLIRVNPDFAGRFENLKLTQYESLQILKEWETLESAYLPGNLSDGFYVCEAKIGELIFRQVFYLGDFRKAARELISAGEKSPSIDIRVKADFLKELPGFYRDPAWPLPEPGDQRFAYFEVDALIDRYWSKLGFQSSQATRFGESPIEIQQNCEKIRIRSFGNSRSWWTSLHEVRLYGKDGEVVSVQDAEASDSQYAEGNSAWNAVDGDLSTRWSAEGLNVILELTLGSPKWISRMECVWYKRADSTDRSMEELEAVRLALDLSHALGQSQSPTPRERVYGFVSDADGSRRLFRLHLPPDDGLSKLPGVVIMLPVETYISMRTSQYFRNWDFSDYLNKEADNLNMSVLWMDTRRSHSDTISPIGIQDFAQVVRRLAVEGIVDRDKVTVLGFCGSAKDALILNRSLPGVIAGAGLVVPELIQGRQDYQVTESWRKAYSPLEWEQGLSSLPLYVLHSEMDTHTPIRQAKALRSSMNEDVRVSFRLLQRPIHDFYPWDEYGRMLRFLSECKLNQPVDPIQVCPLAKGSIHASFSKPTFLINVSDSLEGQRAFDRIKGIWESLLDGTPRTISSEKLEGPGGECTLLILGIPPDRSVLRDWFDFSEIHLDGQRLDLDGKHYFGRSLGVIKRLKSRVAGIEGVLVASNNYPELPFDTYFPPLRGGFGWVVFRQSPHGARVWEMGD